MPAVLVRDLMDSQVLTAAPETSLSLAGKMLDEQAASRLLIVQDGRLIGIVTRRDLERTMASLARQGAAGAGEGLVTAQIMTPHPITVAPDAPAGEAALSMIEQQVSGLPVLDELGRIVGVFSLTWGQAVRLAALAGRGSAE